MCCFLISVDELKSYTACLDDQVGNVKNVDRQQNCTGDTGGTQLYVCHDMAGGYCDLADEVYDLGNRGWELTEAFIYFSHHFITSPPPIWIGRARFHEKRTGQPKKVLGTIICEWDEGQAKLEELLQMEDAPKRLILLARSLGFDGWMLNLEVSVSCMDRLISFVRELGKECKRYLGSRGQIILYDSLDSEGNLKWQNALNELNLDFFVASRAHKLFINYGWTEKTAEESLALAQKNGIPTSSLLFGIDVFGRNQPHCAGGFDCGRSEKVIRSLGAKVCLFAPGWTLEAQAMRSPDPDVDDKEPRNRVDMHKFEKENNRFWAQFS